MADLTITSANVVPEEGCQKKVGVAGEAFGIGVSIYQKSTDKRWYQGDTDVAQADAIDYAISLTQATAAGQPCVVSGDDGEISFGAILTVGVEYYEGEALGGICPGADLGAGEYRRRHGYARTTSILVIDKNWSTEAHG